jgi:hypothetical protein
MKTLSTIFCIFACLLCFNLQSEAQANLYITSDSISKSGDPDFVTVNLMVGNNGDSASVNSFIDFYLATNDNIYPSDSSLIWAMTLPALAPGDTFLIDTIINFCDPFVFTGLPYAFQYGQPFNLAAVADDGDLVNETDESDNVAFSSLDIAIVCTVGILEPSAPVFPFMIVPNPASGQIFISFPVNMNGKIMEIRNMAGQIVKAEKITDETSDVSALPAGAYLVSVNTDGAIYRQKLIVRH